MQTLLLTGAHIKLYINNTVYKVVQGITIQIDYGETEIRGIDSPWPQEIAGGMVTVRGSVKGLRVKNSGGLQAANLRPIWTDQAASPYISIRIQDRQSQEDILFIPQAKVTKEDMAIGIKSTLKLNFDFVGMVPFMPLDRS